VETKIEATIKHIIDKDTSIDKHVTLILDDKAAAELYKAIKHAMYLEYAAACKKYENDVTLIKRIVNFFSKVWRK
jgi:hypothetical protein